MAPSSDPVRVGYYLWRFPSLSETFIQREVAALRQTGLSVEVFADLHAPVEILGSDARAAVADTHYLLPVVAERLESYRRHWQQHEATHLRAVSTDAAEDARIIQQALYLAGHLQEHGITHLHSPWAGASAFIALLAARLAGIPFSLQARASDLHRSVSRRGLAQRLAHARFIVTNCDFNRAFIQQTVPEIGPSPVHVVYEGLPLARFVPHSETRKPDAPLRILSVGRLIEPKGFEYLLHAVAQLRAQGRTVRCTIVGGTAYPPAPDYEHLLTRLHRELVLQDIVRFAGALPFDEVLQEYARADVFVLPSVVAPDGSRDITPNALLEAMAMQLPVIASRITAIPEIIEHRVSGVLIPPRNVEALTQALHEIAGDPGFAHRLGVSARRRIEERFDIERNIQRYVALFTNFA